MKTYQDLPAPSLEANTRSAALRSIIQLKIQQHNDKISFADFMDLALYHPAYGYYQHPDFAIGKYGDFTTAPEISPLFAACFARQCRQIFENIGEAVIFELGAGSGRFALDLLTRLEALQALPERYYIYEISPGLRNKQKTLLKAIRPDLFERVIWLETLPANISGVVIANEVLDAIPFNCFEIHQNRVFERMVTMRDHEFNWELAEASPSLHKDIEQLKIAYHLQDGYQSEVQASAMTLVTQLCKALTNGIILFADYGYGQREYYHPERRHGSMTCFYQHHAHQNPFLYPGLQDITTHIDFTRVIETAADCGCMLLGFTTQSAFLLANGLLEEAALAEAVSSEQEIFHLHQGIKILTMPMEMGDRIKLMAISRDTDVRLNGFSALDRRRDL